MAKTEMRSAFIPHVRVRKETVGVSRTKQSFLEETDINNILAKYQKTGLATHVNKYEGRYGDMPEQSEFHEAMNTITEANSMFAELPSSIRGRFKNDPAAFLEFIHNEDNRDELVEMGILDPPDGLDTPSAGVEALDPVETDETAPEAS